MPVNFRSIRLLGTTSLLVALAVICQCVSAQGPQLPRQPRIQLGQAKRAAYQQGPQKVVCPSNDELRDTLKPLGQLETRIATQGTQMPPDCAAQFFTGEGSAETRLDITRGWPLTAVHWKPSGAVHRPLYFEDAPLERYGQRACYIQPVISAARFYGSVLLLPYKMGYEPPRKCIYTLGYYRPGSCAPCVLQHPPFSATGAALEVGVIAGAILLIP